MHKNKNRLIFYSIIFACASLFVTYYSIMVGGAASNVKSQSNEEMLYYDVHKDDWFSEDVRFVFEKGLMSGTDETIFSPNKTMTRAMVVTVLWRLEGQPTGDNITFDDVKSDAYYYNAVAWAAENKIVSGYNENTFGSDDDVTREQLATIFYRFAGHKGYDISKKADLSKFSDIDTISDYAVNAVEWTIANGIISGTSENTISPQGNALRCQVAAILKRFCNNYNTYNDKEPESVSISEFATSGNSNKNNTGSSSGGNSNYDNGNKSIEMPGNALIALSEVEAKKGDDVKIIASIENIPGILGMTLTLNYNENALTLKSVASGNAFRDVLDFTPSKILSSGSNYVWDGVDIPIDKIKDGEILMMDFHISENAELGKYPITLNYEPGDIVDNNLSEIDLTIKTGYIIIKN